MNIKQQNLVYKAIKNEKICQLIQILKKKKVSKAIIQHSSLSQLSFNKILEKPTLNQKFTNLE